jgi:hypothetical protein
MPEAAGPPGSANSPAGAICIAKWRALPASGIGLRHNRVADASPAKILDFTAAGRRFIHRIALDFTVRTLDFTGRADFSYVRKSVGWRSYPLGFTVTL